MQRKRSLLHPTGGVIKFSVYTHGDEIEAIYIKLKSGRIYKSEEVGKHGQAVIDLNRNGEVIGIEMLEPGKLSVKQFKKIKKDYNIHELDNVKIDRLREAFA